jgi:hypothetical protein
MPPLESWVIMVLLQKIFLFLRGDSGNMLWRELLNNLVKGDFNRYGIAG